MKYIILSLLAACQSIPVADSTKPVEREWSRPEWAEIVRAAAKEYAPHLLTADIRCPKDGEQILFMDLMRAVIIAESGNNPKTVYKESTGIDSIGLLQLSYTDGANYKIKMGDLKDPKDNLVAGVKIMGALTKNLDSSSCSFFKNAGRYWSTLRTPDCWKPARLKSWGNMVTAKEEKKN